MLVECVCVCVSDCIIRLGYCNVSECLCERVQAVISTFSSFLILHIRAVMYVSLYFKHGFNLRLICFWLFFLAINRSSYWLQWSERPTANHLLLPPALHVTGSVSQVTMYTVFLHTHKKNPTLTRMTKKALSLRVAYQLHIFFLSSSLFLFFYVHKI